VPELQSPSAGRSKSSTFRFFRDLLLILLAAILISFLVKTFLFRSFYIPSGSMMNTLQVNDRIIVNELVPNVVGLQRGDVVVFQDPGGWLPASPQAPSNPIAEGLKSVLIFVGLREQDGNEHLIKRVIGMPGDHVVCCDDFGHLSVNGVTIDEPYVNLPEGITRVSGDDFDIYVPADSLWVMGDNRYNSKDSRYNRDTPSDGFVPYKDVVGRAIVVSWPFDRWTWLDDYSVAFKDVKNEAVRE